MSDDHPVTSQGNILPMKRRTEEKVDKSQYVMVCTECQCTTWQITLGGAVQCANCDADHSSFTPQLAWARVHADTIDTSTLEDNDQQKVLRFKGDIARARVAKKVQEWYDDGSLVFAVAYNLNSGTSMWTGIETAKEREWAYRRLQDMRDWLGSFELDDEQESRSFADD